MPFGANIRQARKLRNITTEELANKMNLSRSYITLIETNKRVPGKKHLKKLASILHIKYDLLIEWYIEDIKKKI